MSNKPLPYRHPKKREFQLSYLTAEDICYADFTDAEVGQLFRAIVRYELWGIETSFDERLIYKTYHRACEELDMKLAKYESTCEKNRQNILLRWENAEHQVVSTSDPTADFKGMSNPFD